MCCSKAQWQIRLKPRLTGTPAFTFAYVLQNLPESLPNFVHRGLLGQGVFSSWQWLRDGVHLRQVTRLTQGKHTDTENHIQAPSLTSQFRNTYLTVGLWELRECWGNSHRNRENMHNAHRKASNDRNPASEWTLLPTALQWCEVN